MPLAVPRLFFAPAGALHTACGRRKTGKCARVPGL